VEYAMEAVKQGSCAVGLRSSKFAVVSTLKRAPSELSRHQKKIFKIDDHIAVAMSGLTADGRRLSRFMRDECLNHKFVYESALQVGRLVEQVADKSQVKTARSWTRPYGVGLLVIGYDKTGPHLYQTCPSGNYYEYKATAIGARSQASRTYLERTYETFEESELNELIKHSLLALKESASGGAELTSQNCTIAYVGDGQDLVILDGDDVKPYIEQVEDSGADADAEVVQVDTTDGAATAAAGETNENADGDEGEAPMET